MERVKSEDDHTPLLGRRSLITLRLPDQGVTMTEPGRFGHCLALAREARRRSMLGMREGQLKLIIRKTDRGRRVRGQSK